MATQAGPARFSPGIAAESFIEVQAQLVTIREFVAEEMRTSWERGHDTTRMRSLQKADAAVRAIDTEAKRAAGWADAADQARKAAAA